MQPKADIKQLRANLARILRHLDSAAARDADWLEIYRLVLRVDAIEQRIAEVTA